MYKPNNYLKKEMYQYNAFENFIEYSCYADQLLTGMDLNGNVGDITAFDESVEIGLYENIKKIEALKHAINAEYLRHIAIVKEMFENNRTIKKKLGLFGVINYDLDSWIEHVKIFYINILSDGEIFDIIFEKDITLEDVEATIELIVQLEEYMVENQKEAENQFWN